MHSKGGRGSSGDWVANAMDSSVPVDLHSPAVVTDSIEC